MITENNSQKNNWFHTLHVRKHIHDFHKQKVQRSSHLQEREYSLFKTAKIYVHLVIFGSRTWKSVREQSRYKIHPSYQICIEQVCYLTDDIEYMERN